MKLWLRHHLQNRCFLGEGFRYLLGQLRLPAVASSLRPQRRKYRINQSLKHQLSISQKYLVNNSLKHQLINQNHLFNNSLKHQLSISQNYLFNDRTTMIGREHGHPY